MATLSELEREGSLFLVEPVLRMREQKERLIYLAPAVVQRIERDGPEWGSTWNIDQTPLEQLDALFTQFCAGHELVHPHRFRDLRRRRDGVWELKTADVRLFGCFPTKDIFIGTAVDLKERIVGIGLVPGYCDATLRFIDALNLTAPKYITERDPDAVVSNWAFAPAPRRD